MEYKIIFLQTFLIQRLKKQVHLFFIILQKAFSSLIQFQIVFQDLIYLFGFGKNNSIFYSNYINNNQTSTLHGINLYKKLWKMLF